MASSEIFELRKFITPEIVFGVGARHLVTQYLTNFHIENILIVIDSALLDLQLFKDLIDEIRSNGQIINFFADFTPNPTADSVMEGSEIYFKTDCTGILAVGGGSALDCGKGIGIVASNGRHILDYEGVDSVKYPPPPMICIPTTAGSGADLSQFAIISDTSNNRKIAIVSKSIVPDVSLIDPETLLSLDYEKTLYTSLDAFVHGIEAYVSNAHSTLTDLHALKTISLILEYLPKVRTDLLNLEYRKYLMDACMHAGFAFSNASLGAVHAMAHSLGGFTYLPHGICNAVLLKEVINHNYDFCPARYNDITKLFGLDIEKIKPNKRKELLLDNIQKFYEQIGFTLKLKDIISEQYIIPALVKNALNDPCIVTNPGELKSEDIKIIYESVFR